MQLSHLKDKTIKGFLWVSGAKVVNQGFSWIVTIVLARLLLPSDFGLVATAWIFVRFLDLINELGVGAAVIQRKHISPKDLHSLFFFSLATGILLASLLSFAAPTVATFFDNEKLIPVLRALSLIFVIGAFKTIPFNLLAKNLDFDKRSIAEFISVFSGGTLAVSLALTGHGVWSLVLGDIFRNIILAICALILCSWKPRFFFSFQRVRSILTFGVTVSASRITSFFNQTIDKFIVAKFLGSASLGYYSMAFDLSMIPLTKLTTIVNQVSFPVFSQLQENKSELQTFFLKVIRFVSLITFPAMIGLFLLAKPVIIFLLTEKWLPMLIPLKALCLVAMIKSVDQVIPQLLFARGKPSIVFKINTASTLTLFFGFVYAAKYGIDGVAYAFLFIYPFFSFLLFRYALKELALSSKHLLQNLYPSLISSTFMAILVYIFTFGQNHFYGDNVHFTIAAASMLGIISYFLFLKIFYNQILSEIYVTLTSIRRKRNIS